MTFKEATDRISVPLETIAEATGRSYGTVLAYRNGSREAPPEVFHKLAAFIREHMSNLAELADELER